jgi:antitoxin VapB
MPLNIRSEDVNRLAAELASLTGFSKTEAVRTALLNEIERLGRGVPLRERLRPLLAEVAAAPATGLEADKAFYDELSGDA